MHKPVIVSLVGVSLAFGVALWKNPSTQPVGESAAPQAATVSAPAPRAQAVAAREHALPETAAQSPVSDDDVEVDTFITDNGLPTDAWTRYSGRSLDELAAMQAEMDEHYQALKSTTDAQTLKRRELLEQGRVSEAEQVLAKELVPAFDERRKLGAQAVLLARAKLDLRAELY